MKLDDQLNKFSYKTGNQTLHGLRFTHETRQKIVNKLSQKRSRKPIILKIGVATAILAAFFIVPNSQIFKQMTIGSTNTPTQYPAPSKAQLQPKPEMNETVIKEMAIKATKIFWDIRIGGKILGEKAFTRDNTDYYYLSEEINTREEVLSYLQQIFSQSAAEAYFDQQDIVEYKGLLTAPYLPGDDYAQWDSAKIKLVSESDTSKEYQFEMTQGDYDDNPTYRTIKVKYFEGIGWKIVTLPDDVVFGK